MRMTEIHRIIEQKAGKSALLKDIQAELIRMEEKLLSSCDASGQMRTDLLRIMTAGGKRLRPILAFLCCRLGGGQDSNIQPLLCMLELMHSVSLIHDDVVDSAELRRGRSTINATSGLTAAVQSGDFLLAKAMEQLSVYRGTGINEALAEVSAQMCLGELQQQQNRFKISEQTISSYELQIYRKTASLLGASCYTGALAGGAGIPEAEKLREYGEKLGIAFQLRDDLLDYCADQDSGKIAGQDLRSGIFTLPVLHLLESGVPDWVRELLEKADKTAREVEMLIAFIKSTDAPEYTRSLILLNTAKAVEALRSLPDGAEKTALKELAATLTDRVS